MTRWWCELAYLGGDDAVPGVLVEATDGVFTAVTPGVAAAPDGAVVLAGLTVPGLANAHSHAFHRALRGRTQGDRGTFWTWREQMYAVADRLDPDSYLELATAVFAEMALAGISSVGEFHYLHHGPDGTPYGSANVMGEALVEAAGRAGLRITLLDALYLGGGIGRPLSGPQRRFGDGSADAWVERVESLALPSHARLGAAVHSVRAVPPAAIGVVAAWAAGRSAPLHVHLSEQRAENEACREAYGCTPAAVLASAGALGPRTTAVHGTHLSRGDLDLLGGSGTAVCLCPTTESDLADGIGPARAMWEAGSALCVGSDSHAVIDLFAEVRGVEYGERLLSEQRGHWRPGELLATATAAGHRSLGWPDAGCITPGQRADLVTVETSSVRWAGVTPATAVAAAVFAGTAGDVRHLVVDGRTVVADGRHQLVADPPGQLTTAIAALLG